MTQYSIAQHSVINAHFLNHELTELKLSGSVIYVTLKSEVA